MKLARAVKVHRRALWC